MVISHKDKWIYLANPKCASSTLNNILKKQEDVVARTSRDDLNHMSYVECKQFLANQGLNIDDYFVFSFVRNPWDKIVSFYKWTLRHLEEKTGHGVILVVKNLVDKYNFSELNFHNFITILPEIHWWSMMLNCEVFLFENGQNKLNFIGRVENIEEDFNIVCNKVGILNSNLLYKNNNTKSIKTDKHYTEYYTDFTRDFVAKRYAKDIEYFGYKFGG